MEASRSRRGIGSARGQRLDMATYFSVLKTDYKFAGKQADLTDQNKSGRGQAELQEPL
jgi:hypothetical protein